MHALASASCKRHIRVLIHVCVNVSSSAMHMHCIHEAEASACMHAHKKYSHSFVKSRMNPWCHMDYCTIVLSTFLDLEKKGVVLLSMEGLRVLGLHQKYLNLCSEDERRSYGFGTTWG